MPDFPDSFQDEDGHAPQEEPLFKKRYPSQLLRDDSFFMTLAYNQAVNAWQRDEVPVGAVIEYKGEVVAQAHNMVESTGDPTAHAEIIAITQASKAVGDWRLNGATLYVTKEPCPMCSGAALMARLARVVFAVSDPKMGCLGGATDLNKLPRINHHFSITKGILEADCYAILQAFFVKKREKGREGVDE